ncbi:12893_t:CDS:2 [Dentiscutata heterogama]|uniref:12893_t:CDS:1 n=1 Tax=Dentiscutata heterogama TaxID=1316150 RepID=A0ACA9KHK9_9GLOM|nr:12893_t:CDS:2 [Dentiscutata heterogama]
MTNLLQHLILQQGESIFWSIPLKMMYYLFIPVIVIDYVGITYMGIFLSNKLFGRPNIGAWTGQILGNIIIFARIYMCNLDREIIRLGLLPLSLEEEKDLETKEKQIFNESSVFGISKIWVLECKTGGFLHGSLILAGLLSCNGSFVNIFS